MGCVGPKISGLFYVEINVSEVMEGGGSTLNMLGGCGGGIAPTTPLATVPGGLGTRLPILKFSADSQCQCQAHATAKIFIDIFRYQKKSENSKIDFFLLFVFSDRNHFQEDFD